MDTSLSSPSLAAPSLAALGLAIVCEACEGEIDLLDDAAGTALCRQCGIAFLVDIEPVSRRHSASLQQHSA